MLTYQAAEKFQSQKEDNLQNYKKHQFWGKLGPLQNSFNTILSAIDVTKFCTTS